MRRSRVDAHAHVNRSPAQSFECSGGRLQSAGRSPKGDEEGIPLGIDLDSLIGLESLPQDTAMLSQRLRVPLSAEFMQQLRRTLDVGKEKGDGARRQVVAHLGEGLRSRCRNASEFVS